MDMKTNKMFKGIGGFLDQNAPTIATFGSMIFSGLTVFFAYKAAKAAGRVQEQRDADIDDVKQDVAAGITTAEEGKAEERRVRLSSDMQLIYIYRWSLVSAFLAGGLAFLSNHLNGRTIAGMSAMIALNQDKIKAGTEKVKELVGEEKFEKLRNDINREVLGEKTSSGDIKTEVTKSASNDDADDDNYERYYDTYWGQFIEINPGVLMDAISEAERTTFLKWNDWRGMLGMESCRAGYYVGWGNKNRFKARIGWIDTGDGGTKAIIYDTEPVGLRQAKEKQR